MKISDKLKIYFKKRADTLPVLLKRSSHTGSVSDIHNLRIEIKKLKAVWKFIGFNAKDFDAKDFFRSYGPAFKTAGKIRELQLEEEALKKIIKGIYLLITCAC